MNGGAVTEEAKALAGVKTALRLASVSLPHLAGLAHTVRVHADPRAGTIGVFPSGRVAVNPGWFNALDRDEATYVVAHELFHLALGSHDRGEGTDRALFNEAHDYIINDILTEALGRPPPSNGLHLPGARHSSAEAIAADLRRSASGAPASSWGGDSAAIDSPLATALREAGLVPEPPAGGNDVLPEEVERQWYPGEAPAEIERSRRRVREQAARAVSLERLQGRLEALAEATAPGEDPGGYAEVMRALRLHYKPPWELALQQWLEAVAPGPRSYARPSRRGADRTDVVLAGRKREGWTLHIVLDTSGSMEAEIPRVLGAIASFCESVNVGAVRVIQCDIGVTRDDVLDPEALHAFRVEGFGGSNMSPAMQRLAQDPEVEAAIVITDGDIAYPSAPMPYTVLWALTERNEGFAPSYGHVVTLA
jgi:predicted metal-dependent peptidase